MDTFIKITFLVFGVFALSPNQEPPTPALAPEDSLLASAHFENAQFAVYAYGAEAMLDGQFCKVRGYSYLNAFGGVECVDSAGNYISIDTLGNVRYGLENRSGVCEAGERN